MLQQFRTIISDAGANLGIIISQNRFQRGALEEAKKTNVRLYSWLDFQKAFEGRWTKEMAERFSKLVFENKNLACQLYDMGIKPEHREVVQERTLDLVRRTALLANITFWRDTVFEKHRSVRFCESGPESNASQAGRWVELRTRREFYDYAIRLGEELKLKYHELFSILHAHLSH